MASKTKKHEDSSEESSLEENSENGNDSDLELQQAFVSGQLKPGLSQVIEKETKIFINKVPEIKEKLEEIKLDLEWLERLDVTCNVTKQNDIEIEKNTGDQDDFKREMKFYKQAQLAVAEALPKLQKLGIPTVRPADYFAEMVKTDDHMQKVRQKLVTKEVAMERSEKVKKLREMKKFGKKVQQEILQKRQQEKKKMLDSVKKFRKGQKGKPQFTQDAAEDFDVTTERGTKRPHTQGKQIGKSFKRQKKDVKYGFGGKKRTMKNNTAESTDDVSSFRSTKHGKPLKGKNSKAKNSRLGKSRRQAIKAKKK